MRQFEIQVKSAMDVLAFVSLATKRPFPITVGTERHQVNAKSFMEMFSLNFRQPLTVSTQCSEEEFTALLNDADRFVVK